MKNIYRYLPAALLAALLAQAAPAATPQKIKYQGVLKENGQAVTGARPAQFRITNPDGSTEYWNSGAVTVNASQGLFTYVLNVALLDLSGGPYYLEVSISGQVLLPREEIAATAYALRAATADSMPWSAITGVPAMSGALTQGSVGSYEIADGTVTNTDVASNAAIAYSKLNLAGQIRGTDLAAGAYNLPASTFTVYSLTVSSFNFSSLSGNGSGLYGVTRLGIVTEGSWNANANSPALSSGAGSKGYYYVVSAAGATGLDGSSSWAVNDWAVFNGTSWQRVQSTDNINSVFGRTGVISAANNDYTAAQITNAPAGGLAAVTAQATIYELDAEKLRNDGGTMTGPLTIAGATGAITGIDISGYSLYLSSGLSMAAGTVDARFFKGDGSLLTNIAGVDTAARVSTGAIKLQADNIALSTSALIMRANAIAVSTGVIRTDLNAVILSTGTLASALAGKANIGANTFTGAQTLPGDPASALQAATKQYVDAATEGGACPTGMAYIPGPYPYCVDKYEAYLVSGVVSNDTCTNGSQAEVDANNTTAVAGSATGQTLLVGVNWCAAKKACQNAGKHLLTNSQWFNAANYKGSKWNITTEETAEAMSCNTANECVGVPCPSGANTGCVTQEGIFDMIGNVGEWVDFVMTADPTNAVAGGSITGYAFATGIPTASGATSNPYGNDFLLGL